MFWKHTDVYRAFAWSKFFHEIHFGQPLIERMNTIYSAYDCENQNVSSYFIDYMLFIIE